jgi:ribosomal-protein-alanine N-acetyltransferase
MKSFPDSLRLSLRHVTVADAPFILDLMNEPAYIENIGDRGVRTVSDAERYISEKYLSSYFRHGFGMYLAERKNTGVPIGICGLVKRDALDWPDVGFAITQHHWTQGYASEAASATVEYARKSLSLQRLYGVVKPTNIPSIHILERIGLHYLRPFETPDGSCISLYGVDLSEGDENRQLMFT